MASLHTLWDISDESFRTLVSVRYRPRPADKGAATMPGDGLIPEPTAAMTRSVNVAAPPEAVWPWLAQMMRGGGIYGWAALETAACRSAGHLLPGLPPPRPGDRVGDLLAIALVDAGRGVVWHAPDGFELLGLRVPALTLDYFIEPQGPARSRLIARLRGCCGGTTRQVAGYLCGVIDFILPSAQIERLAALAGGEVREASGAAEAPGVRYQTAAFHPAAAGSAEVAGPT